MIVLTVSGLFKELSGAFEGDELILSFVRTFVLQPIAEKMVRSDFFLRLVQTL